MKFNFDFFNKSVVTVISTIGNNSFAYGTGFIVTDTGYIITSCHNCIDAISVSILFDNKVLKKCQVIGMDKRTDICVLKISGMHVVPLQIETEETPKMSDKCYIIGNNEESSQSMCGVGHIKFDNYISSNVFDSIVIDININKGTSGSPILNKSGRVIGMVNWFMDRDCSGGISAKYILNMFQKIINGDLSKSYIGVKSKPIRLQDILHYNISMLKKSVSGEIVTEEAGIFQKNDIITKINDQNVGILYTKIETLLYTLPAGTSIKIEYYKHNPENGMSWNTSPIEVWLNTVLYPEELDKNIINSKNIKSF